MPTGPGSRAVHPGRARTGTGAHPSRADRNGTRHGARWAVAMMTLVLVAGCTRPPSGERTDVAPVASTPVDATTSTVPAPDPVRDEHTPRSPSRTEHEPAGSADTHGEPAADAPPHRISMAFTGDILPHSPLWRQAERNAAAAGREGHDFEPMLAPLRPVLDAVDLAVCHLETPIAPEGEAFTTNPYYGVPVEIATAIAAAGYDRCSTASNHAADRGAAGIDRTVRALITAGVDQSGMARFPSEIDPEVFEVDGVPTCHLSYTWSYNGLSLPDGQEWRSALIDPERILADVDRARDDGAVLVVVSLHWGAEGVHAPTRYQREIAEAITAPGTIDLVVGHHAHVVQPIELVNDTWVVFGLGNVLSNLPTSSDWPAASQDAVVVTVDAVVADDGTVTIERPHAVPTWVDRDDGWVVRLVDDEIGRDDLSDGRRSRLLASRERTVAVLGEFMTAPPGSS